MLINDDGDGYVKTVQILTSSLAHGRVTLLYDQLNALSSQTASSLSSAFRSTLRRVVANVSELIDKAMSPMGERKVRNILLYRITGGVFMTDEEGRAGRK